MTTDIKFEGQSEAMLESSFSLFNKNDFFFARLGRSGKKKDTCAMIKFGVFLISLFLSCPRARLSQNSDYLSEWPVRRIDAISSSGT